VHKKEDVYILTHPLFSSAIWSDTFWY